MLPPLIILEYLRMTSTTNEKLVLRDYNNKPNSARMTPETADCKVLTAEYQICRLVFNSPCYRRWVGLVLNKLVLRDSGESPLTDEACIIKYYLEDH